MVVLSRNDEVQTHLSCLAVHLGAGKHVILLKDPTAYAQV